MTFTNSFLLTRNLTNVVVITMTGH